MKFNYWNFIVIVGLGSSCALQTAILTAVYVKGGGTTGTDPVTPILPFMILVIAAVIASIWKRTSVRKVWYVSALISGIFGTVLPFWLEFTGSLVQYERAIFQGSPILTRDLLAIPLTVFACTEIATLAAGWYVSTRKPSLKSSKQ